MIEKYSVKCFGNRRIAVLESGEIYLEGFLCSYSGNFRYTNDVPTFEELNEIKKNMELREKDYLKYKEKSKQKQIIINQYKASSRIEKLKAKHNIN